MLRFVPLALTTPLLLTLAGGDAGAPASPRSGRTTATGQIEGTVEISRALASRRANFRIYGDARGAVAPRVPANELASELRNVVVYLQADPGIPAPPMGDTIAVMSQTAERFAPHVLPVVQGTRVDFPNDDDVYHNVFSLSRARTFDLGRYPKGATKSVTFTKPGIVQVFCHIHADMSGVVVVLPNHFFAVPDSAGRYSLRDVPAGDYIMVGWHERTKPVQHRVRVTAGGMTQVDFKLPLGSTPEP